MTSLSTLRRALRLALFSLLLLTAGAAAAQEEQGWTINIKNADLKEFVSQVATITGKTFVVDPRIKGNVTVISSTRMNQDAVYALFLSVLRVHNFIAMPSGEVIRITPNAQGKQTPGPQGALDEIAPEELVTRVVAAQNVDSAELVKILRPLIPQYGIIAAVSEPNIVIINDHADNITRLMEIIEQIDVADENEIVMLDLEHAWVGTVVAMLEKVAPDQIGQGAAGPQRIQLIANERNNTLVVRGKPRPVAEILKLVSKLDRPATSAGSTRVFYLKYGDAPAIAEILSGIISQQSVEGGALDETTIQADESLNAIVVRTDRSKMGEVEEILRMLDVRRSQVLIEAAIVEVSMTDTRDLGVEFAAVDQSGDANSATPLVTSPLTGAINALIDGSTDLEGNTNILDGVTSLSTPTLGAAQIDTSGVTFAAVISALATNQNANLLSTPSLLTLDNQEAKIVVGNEVPFRTGSFTTSGDGSSNPFNTIQREDVGLQLTVTPHVHDSAKSVRMEIDQVITNVIDTPIGDAGFSDVVTSKRTINTVVLADDKQTIVLGGLIQDDISFNDRRVPFFGSIPGIGWLFRAESKSNTKRNLLIFIRPTIVTDSGTVDAETRRKYDDIWEVDILVPGAEKPGDPANMFDGRK